MLVRIIIFVLLTLVVGCSHTMPRASNVEINLTITTPEVVRQICQSGNVYGCAIWYDDKPNMCYIYSIEDVCIVTHEIRHCISGDWHKGRDSAECGWSDTF